MVFILIIGQKIARLLGKQLPGYFFGKRLMSWMLIEAEHYGSSVHRMINTCRANAACLAAH
jgi:hypothetical protein